MCILCTLDTFDGCITKILSIFCPIQNELTFEIYVENARFSATFDLNLIQHTHTHNTILVDNKTISLEIHIYGNKEAKH